MDNDGGLLFCLVVAPGSDQFCRRTTGEGRSETKLCCLHQTTETEVVETVFVVTFRVLTFWVSWCFTYSKAAMAEATEALSVVPVVAILMTLSILISGYGDIFLALLCYQHAVR